MWNREAAFGLTHPLKYDYSVRIPPIGTAIWRPSVVEFLDQYQEATLAGVGSAGRERRLLRLAGSINPGGESRSKLSETSSRTARSNRGATRPPIYRSRKRPRSGRTWDLYRYCWLRDAYFVRARRFKLALAATRTDGGLPIFLHS
jgi:hypothetical protein